MKQIIIFLILLLGIITISKAQQLEFPVNRVKNLTEMTEKTFPELKVKINRDDETLFFGKREFHLFTWDNQLDSLGRLYLEAWEKPDEALYIFVVYEDGQFQVNGLVFEDTLLYSYEKEN